LLMLIELKLGFFWVGFFIEIKVWMGMFLPA